jgi:hypothetical protein
VSALLHPCKSPTKFKAGFDGYLRDLTKAGCGPPKPQRGGCIISQIFDQSANQNHLLPATRRPGKLPARDTGVNATALKVTVSGHAVYGAYFNHSSEPAGYRNDNTTGVAKGEEPETIYMVVSGKHYNGKCCFDYGNAETNNLDDGKVGVE